MERPFTLCHANGECVRGLIHDTHSDLAGIYIPGLGSHMHSHKSTLLAQFAQQHGQTWLRFNQRGVAPSDGDLAALTLSRYLADIRLLLDLLAPRPVLLVGSSLGGWLATIAANRWPQRIHALLLLAPSFSFIQRWYLDLPEDARQDWRESGVRSFKDLYGEPDSQFQYHMVADAWRYDWLRWPPSLNCPVHILHGDADDVAPVEICQAFAETVLCPQLRLQILAGVDHRLSGQDAVLLDAVTQIWASNSLSDLKRIDRKRV